MIKTRPSFLRFVSAGFLFALMESTQLDATQIAVGGRVDLSVSVQGTAPFTYQWLKDGASIAGATADKYSMSDVRTSDAGGYAVIVTNSAGTVTSPAESITVQAVSASSSSNGVAPSGSVSSSTPTSPSTNVLDVSGSTLPATQIVTTGHSVTLTAAGGNSAGQWQYSSDGGVSWSNLSNGGHYSGVTTGTLSIVDASQAMNGNKYRFFSSAVIGSAFSLSVAQVFFPFPVGLTTDAAGNLYVSDTSSDTIQKVSPSGVVILFAGTSGQTGTSDGSGASARFNNPGGVVATADGVLSVCDSANATIRRISATANVTTIAGSTTARGNADGAGGAATFSSPLGICQDQSGNLYVADGLNHTIRKITAGGTVSTIAGSAGVAGNSDGAGNNARFNHPTGMAIDGAGNLYVADTTNNTVRKISAAGAVTTLAGLAGVSGSQDGSGSGALFNNPGGVAVDSAGNIYVADTGNSTVRKISPLGNVSTLAGLPGVAGLLDGTGSNAWFNQPQGLTFDASGMLYIADTGNAAIRRVSLTGVVTTLAFTAGPVVENSPAPSTAITPSSTTSPSVSASTTGSQASTSSGGGGGGAMNGWLVSALVLLGFLRAARRVSL